MIDTTTILIFVQRSRAAFPHPSDADAWKSAVTAGLAAAGYKTAVTTGDGKPLDVRIRAELDGGNAGKSCLFRSPNGQLHSAQFFSSADIRNALEAAIALAVTADTDAMNEIKLPAV